MRLIDADALLIHKFPDIKCDGISEAITYRLGWNNAIEAICENEPSVEKTGEWTPISEGLPKADLIGEEFLVTVGEKDVGRNFVTTFIWEGADGGWNNGFGWNCEDVIAWMPLPESYKGDK